MYNIYVIGVGASAGRLTLEAADKFLSGVKVVLNTARCGLADWLREKGVEFTSFDELYDSADDFDVLSEQAVEKIVEYAQTEEVAFAVLDIRDRAAVRLAESADVSVQIIAGPPTEGALWALANGATDCYAAVEWEDMRFRSDRNAMIREVVGREMASEVKLKLMNCYPAENMISILKPDGSIAKTELENLDRLSERDYDHRTCVFVPAEKEITLLERYGFDDLVHVIRRLRAPDGCAWDRKQTHETLRINLIEEAYEAVDAIDRGDMDALFDELGDVLLQIVLHAQIGSEYDEFDISDVTTAITHKMIFRHQHVFGNASADTPDKVLALWQEIKKKERGQQTQAEVLRSVTKGLPSLMRAEKVQKRAADVGFDWSSAEEAFYKIGEETEELRQAIAQNDGVAKEAGDLLFSVVNVLRLLKLDPELVLNAATEKFIRRFDKMEQKILADGLSMEGMTLEEMDKYWNCVKLSGNAEN